MLHLLFICILLLVTMPLQAQQLVPYHNGKLWGYCNLQKEIKIPLQYQFADEFTNGRAWVKNKHKKWAMVDSTGKLITDFVYHDYNILNDSLFIVYMNLPKQANDYYFNVVNHKGQELFAWIYGHIEEYNAQWLRVRRNFFKDSLEKAFLKDKYILVNFKGEEIYPNNTDLPKKQRELVTKQQDKLYGYVNQTGQVIIPFQYQNAEEFREGLAVVQKKDKYGVIDKKGNIIIDFIYDDIGSYDNGRAIFVKDGMKGLLDKTGKEIIPAIYDEISYFYENKAMVIYNKQIGFIDTIGRVVIPIQYVNESYEWTKPVFPKDNGVFRNGIVYLPAYGWLGKDGTEFFDTTATPPRIPQNLKQFEGIRLANGMNLQEYKKMLLNLQIMQTSLHIKIIDLDNDKIPELTVRYFTGGAHCCDKTEIFRLNENKEYVQTHKDIDLGIAFKDSTGYVVLERLYYEEIAYFYSGYSWLAIDVPTFFKYYYQQGNLILPPTDIQLNKQIEETLVSLSKMDMKIKAGNTWDYGERKSYLCLLLAYYMNNQRNEEKIKALFDKYYLYEIDKVKIWQEIIEIIRKF